MPQYINADIINRADTASVGIDAGRRPPIHKSRSIHPVDDPSGFLYKGFVRVKTIYSLLLLYILETVKSYSGKDDDTFEYELKVCINTKNGK